MTIQDRYKPVPQTGSAKDLKPKLVKRPAKAKDIKPVPRDMTAGRGYKTR